MRALALRLPFAVALASFGAWSVASCKEPTQVQLSIRTDVPLAGRVANVGIVAGDADNLEAAPFVAVHQGNWAADGMVGSITFVPQKNQNGPLNIRVVMAFDRDPQTCSATDTTNCFFARRKVDYYEGHTLRVPVFVYNTCNGNYCSSDTTCNFKNQCVTARVPREACATDEGCSIPGDPEPGQPVPLTDGSMTASSSSGGQDGAVDGSPDGSAAGDAASDAMADASTDASTDGAGPLAITQMVAGTEHTCALVANGGVKCWGYGGTAGPNPLGYPDHLVRGTTLTQLGSALPYVSIGTVTKLAAGVNLTCGLLSDRSLKCWGSAYTCDFGGGSLARVPSMMSPVIGAVSHLGTGGDVIAVTSGASSAYYFGSSYSMTSCISTPQMVTGLGPRTVRVSATATRHGCSILDDDSVACIGNNEFGQLGAGDAIPRPPGMAPAIADLGNTEGVPMELAIGESHSCARFRLGNVKCWGSNFYGQLGTPPAVSRGSQPSDMGNALPITPLGTGRTARSIAAAGNTTCAVLDNDMVKCWGANQYGQLGQGDITSRGSNAGSMGDLLIGIQLGTASRPLGVTTGGNHTCVWFADGRAKCWGNNGRGQLGIGSTTTIGENGGEMGGALPYISVP